MCLCIYLVHVGSRTRRPTPAPVSAKSSVCAVAEGQEDAPGERALTVLADFGTPTPTPTKAYFCAEGLLDEMVVRGPYVLSWLVSSAAESSCSSVCSCAS